MATVKRPTSFEQVNISWYKISCIPLYTFDKNLIKCREEIYTPIEVQISYKYFTKIFPEVIYFSASHDDSHRQSEI